MFFSPIEVPVGSEPGALEWWHDPNDDSELEPRMHRDQRPPSPPPPSGAHERREECDKGVQQDCSHQCHDQSRSEPHLVPDELNSPTEVRRRAIAQSIVQNMRLWNSDSDSFSELSSEKEEEEEEGEGEKSSASWVTEEEEVIVGMRGSELQEQEVMEIVMEADDNNNCRDLPAATTTTTTTAFGDIVVHVQSESGVESAESWFTSSDTSHSQPCSQEQSNCNKQNDSGLNSIEVLEDGQRTKVERGSVCSSISTDDSLAWETACEDLPPPQLCS